MKIFPILMTAAALVACAGTPTETMQSSGTQTAQKPAANNSESVLSLQRQGYKIVNKNGEEYFCRTEAKTGSRLSHDTVCMTQRELEELRERTQQNMGNIVRQTAPPQGK